MALRINPRLAWQTINDEVVIVDLPNGRVIGLNGVASFIWPLLLELDEEAVAREVASRFAADAETARRDVAEFVATLRLRGLLA